MPGLHFHSLCTTYSTARAKSSHWFMFKGVQSRREFSFIAHGKKNKRKKNKSRDLHNFAQDGESSHRKVSGTASMVQFGLDILFPFLLFFFLGYEFGFYEKNKINAINTQHHKLYGSLRGNAFCMITDAVTRRWLRRKAPL